MLLLIVAILGATFNRLRGGAFDDISGAKQQTQAQRLTWAIPTASLTAIVTHGNWMSFGELSLMFFLSWSAFGHGAHMVYDRSILEIEHFAKHGHDTELTTGFWLVPLFGGHPDDTWSTGRIYLFHMAGMSAIGAMRGATATLPLWFVPGAWPVAVSYITSGLAHGPLYLLGFQTPWDGRAAECLVGAWCWFIIYSVGSTLS